MPHRGKVPAFDDVVKEIARLPEELRTHARDLYAIGVEGKRWAARVFYNAEDGKAAADFWRRQRFAIYDARRAGMKGKHVAYFVGLSIGSVYMHAMRAKRERTSATCA